MTEIVSKISALPHKELEKVAEDLWCRALNVQRLTYLLMCDLEVSLDENRARSIDGETVTLMFQKRSLDVTLWLVSQAWSKAADLEELLDDLQSDAPAGAPTPTAVRMTGGQRHG